MVVEADAGGQREQPCGDADGEVAWCSGAVAFEGEEVFACPEDRLDPLSDRREVRPDLRLGLPWRSEDGGGAPSCGLGDIEKAAPATTAAAASPIMAALMTAAIFMSTPRFPLARGSLIPAS